MSLLLELRTLRRKREIVSVQTPKATYENVRVVSEGFAFRESAWFVWYVDDEDRDLLIPHLEIVGLR